MQCARSARIPPQPLSLAGCSLASPASTGKHRQTRTYPPRGGGGLEVPIPPASYTCKGARSVPPWDILCTQSADEGRPDAVVSTGTASRLPLTATLFMPAICAQGALLQVVGSSSKPSPTRQATTGSTGHPSGGPTPPWGNETTHRMHNMHCTPHGRPNGPHTALARSALRKACTPGRMVGG